MGVTRLPIYSWSGGSMITDLRGSSGPVPSINSNGPDPRSSDAPQGAAVRNAVLVNVADPSIGSAVIIGVIIAAVIAGGVSTSAWCPLHCWFAGCTARRPPRTTPRGEVHRRSVPRGT
jgi:hypothetical protein